MQHQQNETVSHTFECFDNDILRILLHKIEILFSNYLNKYIGKINESLDNLSQQFNQFQNKMNDIEMFVIKLCSKDENEEKMKEQINKLEKMTIEKIREVKEQTQQANESINKRLEEQDKQFAVTTTDVIFHRFLIKKILKNTQTPSHEDIHENTQTPSHEDRELIRGVVEEEMMTECLTQDERQINFLNTLRDIVLNERNTTSMSDKESCVIPKEVKYKDSEITSKHQIKQLEEWTEKRISNILFDSDKDDWNYDTSVFGERVMNKEHIIIIIEDEEGNKFGGYINSKIDEVGYYIYDSQSFVFSLESNGRIEGMKKFDIEIPQHAFCLFNQSDDRLFEFGHGYSDILVYKENNKTYSYCNQYSFEYEGISNALCGKEWPNYFTPKRIIVIELK
ncbi:trichohyalin, putative [Entamoeba histolytica]